MAVVYVTRPGVKIHLESKHLLAVGEDFRQTIYTFNLERLVLVGKIEITYAALSHLFRNQTTVIFLTRQGGFLGAIAGAEPKNVYLRLKQYERFKDEKFRMETASSIVRGKIRNMRSLTMRLGRTLKVESFSRPAHELLESLHAVDRVADLPGLRGVEGNAARTYFQTLRWAFPKELKFSRRVRRPPTDPVNACLSFGYTILMNVVHGAVCSARLDPALGCLHEASYGRNSLTLDLMEEFRTPVVDMTVLSCFNLGILKKHDFDYIEPSSDSAETIPEPQWLAKVDILQQSGREEEAEHDMEENNADEPGLVRAVYLNPDARKRFLKRLEKRFSTTMHYQPTGKDLELRQVIQRQAEQYANRVRGELDAYTPITPR